MLSDSDYRTFHAGQYRQARFASDAETENPEAIRDVRNFCAGLPVYSEEWIDYLNDLYRDYHGVIVDADDNQIVLNMEQFERPHIREWFRDFCSPVPDDVTPRVRQEARGRVKILITILRATFPKEATRWGLRAANDNEPAEAGCRQK